MIYIDPDADSGGDGTTPALSSGDNTHAWDGWDSRTFAASTIYAGAGGKTATITDKINISNDNVTFTSYGTGRHKIDGESTQSTDASRNFRIDADNFTLDNLELTAPAAGGAGNSVMVQATRTGFTVTNCVFTGPNPVRDVDNKAIVIAGDAPFDIGDFTVTGFNIGIQLVDNTPGIASIHDATITLDGHANQAGTGAGIFFNTTGSDIDWNYQLTVDNITATNWSENAVDLVGASNVIVQNCDFSSPSGDYATPAALYLGTTNNSAFGNIVRRCNIHDMTTGSGIHSRGGTLCRCYGNIFKDLVVGIYNGSTGSDDNQYNNNTFIDCTNGVQNYDTNTGTVFANNVIQGETTAVYVDSGTLTYSNNIYEVAPGTGTDGGGNLTSDPLLDVNYVPTQSSPCVAAGTKWWAFPPVGYNGEPFPSYGIDIGANQSLFSPFHPVNL